jgi:phosphatidylserine decarboxylase
LFRQIAGALARRIVWYVKEGDVVEQGQQFGFIKFGSRVDIFLPLGTKINVELNQVVKGGRTVLAELTNNVALPDVTSDVVNEKIPDSDEPLTDEHGAETLVIEREPEKEQAVKEAQPVKKPATKASATPAKKPATKKPALKSAGSL